MAAAVPREASAVAVELPVEQAAPVEERRVAPEEEEEEPAAEQRGPAIPAKATRTARAATAAGLGVSHASPVRASTPASLAKTEAAAERGVDQAAVEARL